MRTTFQDRHELVHYVRQHFPHAAAIDDSIADRHGGRQAALNALRSISPARYGKTRNYLNGAVTHLSPYIRHGILTLTEVRNAALDHVDAPNLAGALIKELGWRAYFQAVYRIVGRDVWTDLEAYKTGLAAESYADSVPEDVQQGITGLACIDAFSRQLRQTGYLHNHARMWLAAYLVHWRRVRWQAGARWFLTHLLDGDPASNNLSWQWVASTFSHKPYIFNRQNLERFAGDQYCRDCPLKGHCELDAEYESLAKHLFPSPPTEGAPRTPDGPSAARRRLAKVELSSAQAWVCEDGNYRTVAAAGTSSRSTQDRRPLIWVHGDCLHPESAPFQAYPAAPAIWVWDEALLDKGRISLKRVLFLYESLLDLPVTIERGAVAERVVAHALEAGCDSIITVASIAPRFRSIVAKISRSIPVIGLSVEPFVQVDEPVDLRRFSRYWRTIGRYAAPGSTQSTK